MAETNINFESDPTAAITSLNVLASDTSAGLLVACSAAVDNTSGLYLDVLPFLTINYTNNAPTTAYVSCFYAAYDGAGWTDDGYGDAPDGTDQTVTIGSPTAHKFAGIVPVTQNRITTKAPLISVATAFGFVPKRFSVLVHNGTGQTIATTTNFVHFTAVTATTA